MLAPCLTLKGFQGFELSHHPARTASFSMWDWASEWKLDFIRPFEMLGFPILWLKMQEREQGKLPGCPCNTMAVLADPRKSSLGISLYICRFSLHRWRQHCELYPGVWTFRKTCALEQSWGEPRSSQMEIVLKELKKKAIKVALSQHGLCCQILYHCHHPKGMMQLQRKQTSPCLAKSPHLI